MLKKVNEVIYPLIEVVEVDGCVGEDNRKYKECGGDLNPCHLKSIEVMTALKLEIKILHSICHDSNMTPRWILVTSKKLRKYADNSPGSSPLTSQRGIISFRMWLAVNHDLVKAEC